MWSCFATLESLTTLRLRLARIKAFLSFVAKSFWQPWYWGIISLSFALRNLRFVTRNVKKESPVTSPGEQRLDIISQRPICIKLLTFSAVTRLCRFNEISSTLWSARNRWKQMNFRKENAAKEKLCKIRKVFALNPLLNSFCVFLLLSNNSGDSRLTSDLKTSPARAPMVLNGSTWRHVPIHPSFWWRTSLTIPVTMEKKSLLASEFNFRDEFFFFFLRVTIFVRWKFN